MPGPTLAVHGAGEAGVAGAADAPSGTSIETIRRHIASGPHVRKGRLSRARLRFFWIDPEVGDGLRNEVRTVLLAELECM